MAKKITILAIGGAGCRIIREFVDSGLAGDFRLLALDSDLDALHSSGLPDDALLQAGKLWRSGRGCGGDIMAGQMAVANERRVIGAALADTEVLITVSGLGGGLASGGLPVVLGEAARKHITAVVLTTLPFAMEGFRRRKVSDERIAEDILPVADAVIALPNDLLFNTMDAETPIADAFRFSDRQMAQSLFALTSIFGSGNLFNADFASFTGALKRRHALCALGCAVTACDSARCAEELLEGVLEAPLLGGSEAFDTADAVAFSLLGGPELSMGNVRAVLDLAVRHVDPAAEKEVLLGTAVSPEFAGKMLLTALAIRYQDGNDTTESAALGNRSSFSSAAAAPETNDGEQLVLPIPFAEEKGIMENTIPVVVDGEDLDIPTYKRRSLIIDPGR